MGKKAMPIDLIVMGGRSAQSKETIETRRESEVKPGTDQVEAPDFLCEFGRKEFYRLHKELLELNLLTNIDTNQLALYCDAFARYVEAAQHINTHGLVIEHTNKFGATNLTTNPYVRVATKYMELIKKYCADFGFTPSARASMAIKKSTAKKEQPKEEPKPEPKKIDRVSGLI